MLADHTSYLVQDPHWMPAKEHLKSGFDATEPLMTMHDLIRWTTNHAMHF